MRFSERSIASSKSYCEELIIRKTLQKMNKSSTVCGGKGDLVDGVCNCKIWFAVSKQGEPQTKAVFSQFLSFILKCSPCSFSFNH